MAWFSLVLACVYLSIHSSVLGFPDMTETLDWKLAMKKIEELQKIVKFQEERITFLEKRPNESTEQVTELQSILKKQSSRIIQLESRVVELEVLLKEENEPIVLEASSKQPANISNKGNSVIRKERLLNLQPTSVQVERVAFYAYLSNNDAASSATHHIVVFDKVVTNVGNAYHPHSGTFIAPRSGLYVFTWTIRQWGTYHHVTELLVNNDIVNAVYMDAGDVTDGSVTGTVVVHVNQGDDVLVRTGSQHNSGDIVSNSVGHSSFVGWNLL